MIKTTIPGLVGSHFVLDAARKSVHPELIPPPSGNQTWLAGKSPMNDMNGGFTRKFANIYGPFSSHV